MPPRDEERTVGSCRENVLVRPASCLHLMLPINNWLNHRRKCAAINPYEMTLIMWQRQKKKRRKNPDQVVCGVEVSQGPPEASVLVASSSVSKACCHCCDVNKPCGTLQGRGKLFYSVDLM